MAFWKNKGPNQIDGTTRRVLLRVFFESMKCERYPSLKLTWLLKIGLPKRKAVSLPPFSWDYVRFAECTIFDNLTEWLWGVRWVKCIGSLLIKMSGKQSRSVKGGKDLEVCSCYGEFLCRYNSGRIGMTYIHGSETKLINKTTSTILTGKTKVAGRKQAMCKSKWLGIWQQVAYIGLIDTDI